MLCGETLQPKPINLCIFHLFQMQICDVTNLDIGAPLDFLLVMRIVTLYPLTLICKLLNPKIFNFHGL